MNEASASTEEATLRTHDERARLRATANNFVLHLHPPRVASHAIR